MSISINRNEIVHMDDYYRDRKRETFKPLIQQMSEDMLDNGFKDVGPQITKISINDDNLTQFIDEFICFYYDSSVGQVGKGASGINVFGKVADYDTGTSVYTNRNEVGNLSATTYFLDGEKGSRIKKIDDIYDNPNWNENIAKKIPAIGYPNYTIREGTHSTNSKDNAITGTSNYPAEFFKATDGTAITHVSSLIPNYTKEADNLNWGDEDALELDTSVFGQVLGPNSELFAYLNPHPNMRGSTQAIRDFIAPNFPSSPSNGDTHTIHTNDGPVIYTYDGSIWNGADGSTHTGTSTLDSSVLSDGGSVKGIPFGSGWKDINDLVPSSGFTWPTQAGAYKERGDRTDNSRPLDLKDGHFYKKTPGTPDIATGSEVILVGLASATEYAEKGITDSTGWDFITTGTPDATATPPTTLPPTASSSKAGQSTSIPVYRTLPAYLNQAGYVGLSEISKAVYLNEFNKVKTLLTHQSRGVVMRPDSASGVNTKATIRNYRKTVEEKGPDTHDFWISNYKDENFFPAGTVEPKKFEGELMIGFDSTYNNNVFQTGDVYTFSFIHTAFGAGAQTFTIPVEVVQSTVAGFSNSVFEALSKNQLFDPASGAYSVVDGGTLSPKRNGVLIIESNNIGSNLTSSVSRVARPMESFTNNIQSYIVTDNNTLFNSTMTNGDGGTAYTLNTFENGYVHEIQLRGFSGANNDDEFEFTINNLLDELPNGGLADVNNPALRSETIYFKTGVALNSGQLTEAIAAKIRQNAYMNKYMEVISNSNAITLRYNRLSSGYMKKGDVGKSHGLLAANSVAQGGTGSVLFTGKTVGQTNSEEFSINGIAEEDVPAAAKFNIVGNAVSGSTNITAMRVAADGTSASTDTTYLAATLLDENDFTPAKTVDTTGDPFNYRGDNGAVEVIQVGLGTSIKRVRLEFPLARDLGTFAMPVHGQYTAYVAPATSRKTSYFSSYEQMVLAKKTGRPEGPQVSFDSIVIAQHPNTSHGGVQNGIVGYEEFETYSHDIDIETFEYITDYSMGPVVLETDRLHKLSGYPTGREGEIEGDQPWRIRLNITRGHEIQEASPYIADAVLQVNPEQDSSNSFEYLQVHVATEFQLKGDGTVAKPEGKDGLSAVTTMREPGHLGGLRPQYKGYLETAVHKVNPFVQRSKLDSGVRTGFNFSSGVVGIHHFNDSHELMLDHSSVFTQEVIAVPASGSGATAVTAVAGVPKYFSVGGEGEGQIPLKVVGSRIMTDYDSGILVNDEYRYEEHYLRGTSTELVHDTPYNNGNLRLQKGLFRRTGKSRSDIAPAYPMSYYMTIVDHGIAFYLRDQASTQADDNAFFVVQRHVHSSAEVGNGTTSAPQFRAGYPDMGIDGSDHQPIHCVYQSSEPTLLYSDLEPLFTEKDLSRRSSIANMGLYDLEGNQTFDFMTSRLESAEMSSVDLETQSRFRRFVVREKDVLKPWDRHVFAGVNERDSTSIINPLEQLSLNDRGKLVIQFPNRLGSQRFMYTGREIDLIGFCAAGAVGQDTLISSDRMSTAGQGGTGSDGDYRRLYRGMMSTGEFGSGMRILLLVAENAAGDSIMPTNADIRLLDN